MAWTRRKFRVVGAAAGAVLVAAGVVSIFVIRWDTSVEPEPPPIRPVKTIVVGEVFSRAGRSYPGRVKATQRVDLAFHVSGPLVELPIREGLEVEEGQLLARIDPRDFQNDLAAKRAILAKAKSDLERVAELERRGGATRFELTEAQAKFEVAQARSAIATKALEDTYLRAPFTGRVATRFVENFQNVQAKQPILSLQDVTSVEVVASIPEQRVALAQEMNGKLTFAAEFDYLPGRRFAVKLKEFASEADPATQTYAATFAMPAPGDVIILPGMTAMVREFRAPDALGLQRIFALPIEAVVVDGLGNYYVWLLRKSDPEGVYTTHRGDLTVGDMSKGSIEVLKGLTAGDRVAAAGVHFLQEGKRVTLFVSKAEARGP